MTKDPASRRATVILFGLCVIAASAIAGAAVYRYMFWGDQLPGGFQASPADHDGDGSPEYLVVQARVDLPESGDYSANAVLLQPSTGAAIAQTTGRVELDRGSNVFGVGFWGPDIHASGIDGPYVVRLTFIREDRDSAFELPPSPDMIGRVYEWSFRTPAYGAASFQEQRVAVSIGTVTTTQADASGDGTVDAYTIRVPLTIRDQGVYSVRAESDDLFLEGVTNRFFGPSSGDPNTVGAAFVSMEPGSSEVILSVWPEQVYLSGIDGPTDIHITVLEARVQTESHPCCGTETTEFVEEPAFAPPPDGSELGLRRPYVLPPTPLGLKAEAHLEPTLHWYDFQAPWMPIEFTGEVRDYGTDVDGNGLFESLTVEAGVSVRNWGWYDVSGTLYAAGSEPSNEALMRSVPTEDHVVTTAWNRVSLGSDQSWVRVDFTGAEILGAGRDGPFDAKLRIVPANVVIDPIIVHTTAAYTLAQFEPTGPKPARISSVTTEDLGGGTYAIHVSAHPGSSYTLITRVIHANGVVSLEVVERGDGDRTYQFTTEAAAAGDFAVAVYLQDPYGVGADYIEIPLAVA